MNKYKLTIQSLAEGQEPEPFFESTFLAPNQEEAEKIAAHINQLTAGGFSVIPEQFQLHESVLTKLD